MYAKTVAQKLLLDRTYSKAAQDNALLSYSPAFFLPLQQTAAHKLAAKLFRRINHFSEEPQRSRSVYAPGPGDCCRMYYIYT